MSSYSLFHFTITLETSVSESGVIISILYLQLMFSSIRSNYLDLPVKVPIETSHRLFNKVNCIWKMALFSWRMLFTIYHTYILPFSLVYIGLTGLWWTPCVYYGTLYKSNMAFVIISACSSNNYNIIEP